MLDVLIGVPPPWRDNISTTAGSPFASVRLFPMKRTRPPRSSSAGGAVACDGATGDELQLVTTAAATMEFASETVHPARAATTSRSDQYAWRTTST